MKKILYLAAVIALASLATGPASASTVYDNTNGFLNGFNVDGWNINGLVIRYDARPSPAPQ